MKKIRWNNVLCVVAIIFIIWVAASVIDVDIHNNINGSEYGEFSTWNLFSWFI